MILHMCIKYLIEAARTQYVIQYANTIIYVYSRYIYSKTKSN